MEQGTLLHAICQILHPGRACHVKDPAADSGRNVPAGSRIPDTESFPFKCLDYIGNLFLCLERIEVDHAIIGKNRQECFERVVHPIRGGDDEPVKHRLLQTCGIEGIRQQGVFNSKTCNIPST